jgi:histone deacetylase complex subunit SAP18
MLTRFTLSLVHRKDATLREVLTTLRVAAPSSPELRHPLARFSFRAIYADAASRGRYSNKDLGTVYSRDVLGEPGSLDSPAPRLVSDDDVNASSGKSEERTLDELRFVPGDYLCVAVHLPKNVTVPVGPAGELAIKGTAGGPAPAGAWKSAAGAAGRGADGGWSGSLGSGPAGRGGGGHWRGGSDATARGGRGAGRGGADTGRKERDSYRDDDRRPPPPRRSPPPPRRGGWGRGGRSRSRSRSPPPRRRD